MATKDNRSNKGNKISNDNGHKQSAETPLLAELIEIPGKLHPVNRPRTFSGSTTYYQVACGKIFITVNTDVTGYPVEVWLTMGKSGGCTMSLLEGIARTASIALRCGISADELVKQYSGIVCTGGSWDGGKHITSCVSTIGMAIQSALDAMQNKIKMAGNRDGYGGDIGLKEAERQVKELEAERDRLAGGKAVSGG